MTEGLTRDTPVRFLKGVGPVKASRLLTLGVQTVEDLLYLFPRRYENRGVAAPLGSLQAGSFSSAVATVLAIERKPTRRRNLTLVTALLSDGSSLAQAVWFNRKGLERVLTPGTKASFYGKVERRGGLLQYTNPEFEVLADEDDPSDQRTVVPVYPGTEGLYQKWLRRLISDALETFPGDLVDPLPPSIRESKGFMSRVPAVAQMHYPSGREEWALARKRLAYEELFLLQVALAIRKQGYREETGGEPLEWEGPLMKHFREGILPFSLTRSQEKVLGELAADSSGNVPMNRLLQGDVGSGKTAVAVIFLIAAVDSGFQGAIMAPTEILARQHFKRISGWLSALGVPVHLLTGSLPDPQREGILADIASGEPCIVVGTHALIQKTVRFGRLAAVVVDEQHRFGVLQRGALTAKGSHPHVLVMTATPIPRTLTLSVYGDLAFSVIDELPPGRTPTETRYLRDPDDPRLARFIANETAQGRRVYWVCPVIEESDKLPLMPVIRRHETLSKRFPGEKVGILHGQLPPEERQSTMERFVSGELSILVSTTVVEVGVDVRDATVMVIEDAHRFGLSQLHQLRGRVGRGEVGGFCFLVGKPGTEDGRARIEAMRTSSDGFEIAERDLALRGPGEICGVRQHGITDFKVADLVKDRDLLEEAREDAFTLVGSDPVLSGYPDLRREVFRKLGTKLKLAGTA
ncbi:MAG TPA: ATP-dependent DNA helicase RecG [Synergistales bacterium]|nr:ATP-dependent DNA helicase RecG [Synergistales bacterium]